MNTNLSILREIIKYDFVFISLVHVIYDVIPFTNTGRQSPTLGFQTDLIFKARDIKKKLETFLRFLLNKV